MEHAISDYLDRFEVRYIHIQLNTTCNRPIINEKLSYYKTQMRQRTNTFLVKRLLFIYLKKTYYMVEAALCDHFEQRETENINRMILLQSTLLKVISL